MKLHTMNLVAAGPPLRDNIFFCIICLKYSGMFVTHSLSTTAPFPSLLIGKKKKKEDFFLILRCTWDGFGTHRRSVVLGSSTH